MAKSTPAKQQQPNIVFVMADDIGWFNLRLDPFERTGMGQSMEQADWFKYEFWRFVFVQQEVAKAAQTFIDFPPLQPPASFNMEAVKAQVVRAIHAHHSA